MKLQYISNKRSGTLKHLNCWDFSYQEVVRRIQHRHTTQETVIQECFLHEEPSGADGVNHTESGDQCHGGKEMGQPNDKLCYYFKDPAKSPKKADPVINNHKTYI